MNKHLRLAVRNAACSLCKLHTQAEGNDRCRTGEGNHRARIMIVSKSPLGDRGKAELTTYLTRAGFDVDSLVFCSAIKCLVWDLEASKTDQKACKPYLQAEIQAVKPEWILTLGNEALFATTGRTGIMKYRGRTFEVELEDRDVPAFVIPTIAPSMIYRNPGLKDGFEADLRYFYRLSQGIADDPMNTPVYHKDVMTKADLFELEAALQEYDHCSYDLETSGYDEFQPNTVGDDPMIITMAVTLWNGTDLTDSKSFGIPLAHPLSPFRRVWQAILWWIYCRMIKAKIFIAHNGKFDNRWLRQFGCPIKLTFDTMLAAHLLNENRPKGLKPLAQAEFGVEPWAMDVQGDGWYHSADLAETLLYNVLDTWHTARLYTKFQPQLKANKRLLRIFKYITMPASETYTEVERAGVWVDRRRVMERWKETKERLETLDAELMDFVPEDWADSFPKKTVPNFKPSNFLRWFLFEELDLPVLARGKAKENGEPGDPSVADSILKQLSDHHPCVPKLLERAKYQKYESAFFSSYADQMDENSRIRTNFKLAGTSTGRTASGKADAEKVTGSKNIRGVNMQQVPRDKFVKSVFGVPEGWLNVTADYSQLELRVAAFLAQEPTMLEYYNQGIDIHTAMAVRITGLVKRMITSHHRTMAKSVNFGFLFGMNWPKYIETAWKNYGLKIAEEEARKFRNTFFEEFPILLRWHQRQRALVRKYKRIESPLGRVRNLPDVDSPKDEVRAEAERQAINSPVQSFGSDMTLMSVNLIHGKFKKLGLESRVVGTVHDSIISEVKREEAGIALPIIKDTMENLPLAERFGVHLNVPIQADLSVGKHWGEETELSPEQIYGWEDSLYAGLVYQ